MAAPSGTPGVRIEFSDAANENATRWRAPDDRVTIRSSAALAASAASAMNGPRAVMRSPRPASISGMETRAESEEDAEQIEHDCPSCPDTGRRRSRWSRCWRRRRRRRGSGRRPRRRQSCGRSTAGGSGRDECHGDGRDGMRAEALDQRTDDERRREHAEEEQREQIALLGRIDAQAVVARQAGRGPSPGWRAWRRTRMCRHRPLCKAERGASVRWRRRILYCTVNPITGEDR